MAAAAEELKKAGGVIKEGVKVAAEAVKSASVGAKAACVIAPIAFAFYLMPTETKLKLINTIHNLKNNFLDRCNSY